MPGDMADVWLAFRDHHHIEGLFLSKDTWVQGRLQLGGTARS